MGGSHLALVEWLGAGEHIGTKEIFRCNICIKEFVFFGFWYFVLNEKICGVSLLLLITESLKFGI